MTLEMFERDCATVVLVLERENASEADVKTAISSVNGDGVFGLFGASSDDR